MRVLVVKQLEIDIIRTEGMTHLFLFSFPKDPKLKKFVFRGVGYKELIYAARPSEPNSIVKRSVNLECTEYAS